MRNLAATIALVAGMAPLAGGCTPARIVAADGPRVTYAWKASETTISRVYQLAVSYCDGRNAPPRLVGDTVDGDERTTTFACVPWPTMPLNRVL
jgi:hypothetical protein